MTVLTFSSADWAVVAAYLAFILYLGIYGSRMHGTTSERFLLGGRMLTLPGFVAALVSTWYGGILGVGEFSYLHGIANWTVFGLPYYIFALVFACYFAKRVRETKLYSIPDMLFQTYGKRSGLLGSVMVFFLSSPAPYFLMLAVLLQVVTGWALLPCLLTGTFVAVVYVFVGGFRAVIRTDLVQFALMFAGFILLLAFLIPEYGITEFLPSHVPAQHLTFTGGNSWQYILVWFFIALWTLVAPQFHQFTLSARSPETARNGILLSIGFWLMFDFITTVSGLYARALLPALDVPAMAYPMLAENVLPSIAKGFFYVGMLATVMSTTDGLTFISSITVGRDIIARCTGRMNDADINRFTRAGMAITAVFGIGSVLLFPSVINLWYVIGTLFIPALLLPLTTAYYKRFRLSSMQTFIAMLIGFLGSAAAFIVGQMQGSIDTPAYPLGIEPMYVGLLLSIMIYISGNIRAHARDI